MEFITYKEYVSNKQFKIDGDVIENLIAYDIDNYGTYIYPIYEDEQLLELFGRKKSPEEKVLADNIAKMKKKYAEDLGKERLMNKQKKLLRKIEKAGERRTGLKTAYKASPPVPIDVKNLGKGKKALITPRGGKVIAIGAIAIAALVTLAAVIRKKMKLKQQMEENPDNYDDLQNQYSELDQKETVLRDKIDAANSDAQKKEDAENENYYIEIDDPLLEDLAGRLHQAKTTTDVIDNRKAAEAKKAARKAARLAKKAKESSSAKNIVITKLSKIKKVLTTDKGARITAIGVAAAASLTALALLLRQKMKIKKALKDADTEQKEVLQTKLDSIETKETVLRDKIKVENEKVSNENKIEDIDTYINESLNELDSNFLLKELSTYSLIKLYETVNIKNMLNKELQSIENSLGNEIELRKEYDRYLAEEIILKNRIKNRYDIQNSKNELIQIEEEYIEDISKSINIFEFLLSDTSIPVLEEIESIEDDFSMDSLNIDLDSIIKEI